MKILLPILCCVAMSANAQLTTLSNGGNKKASITERIGLTDVTINYSRPALKGREGKIWGQLVAYGFTDLGFGTSKAAPWRAGANENTTIHFTEAVSIEGKPLPAGTYGFFIALGADQCTLIFSNNSTSWGSFFYDQREDALRVQVKPVVTNQTVEWLRYEFSDQTDSSAVVALLWEKMKIPFKISVDYINSQLASFRRELRTDKGFTWRAWQEAAQFCANKNVNLEEGLTWAQTAINTPFISDSNFVTLSTKALILEKLKRNEEAAAIMKAAMPLGKIAEIHAYARQLIINKKPKDAFDAFKLNHDRHPGQFTTTMGLARGYAAVGQYKEALGYAKKALLMAPDKANKDNITNLIVRLEQGKDIN